MFEEQIKVHLQDVMDGKSIAVVPKVEKIPEPIKPVVEETARSATPIAIAPDESILDVSKESDKIKSEVFKERSVPEVVTIDKPTDQKMEEVSVKKPEKLELEEESLPNMIDPILPAVSKPADKPVERAKFEKMEITTNEPIQNPRKNAPIPEFATKSHQKPPEKTETSRKIEQSVTKKPVKKEDKAEKPPLKKPSSQSKTTNAVESFQPEALLGRTVAAFVPVMVEDEEDEEMERESCYVVKVRRYDERTRLYTVIDPEPDADEPMPTVWEIPRSKIVEYKRPRITSEGKLADIQIGDLVFALYREDGSKTPSTEFYKAMVKKFVKESVIVSYIDGDNENNLAFHELFKPPPYPALRKNESRNSDSSTGSQSDKYNRKRDAGGRGPQKHMKRLNSPHHWMLDKLTGTWAPRPSPGPHKLRESLPLIVFLRNRLKYALTNKETKSIVMERLIKVDGKVRTDMTYPAGFMDVITIEKTGENFRLVYDVKGRFTIHRIEAEEAKYKLCKVRKMQLGAKGIPYIVTHDGRTIRYPDPLVKVNDTVKVDVETGKATEFIKFENGNLAYITGGRNMGRIGVITHRERHHGGFDIVHIKDALDRTFATRLSNVFVIGQGNKAWISLPKGKGVKLTIAEERDRRREKAAH
ncbi:40S ribosomal protein S4 [Nowakowskiella sp. JEL0407]|nr:40S ribosomal protein S4 [Nowakowskiella sp. JEL0407]